MTKIAISLPDDVFKAVDELVRQGRFPSRSRALAEGARLLARQEQQRMYEAALEQLNPEEERRDANSFTESEDEWPEY